MPEQEFARGTWQPQYPGFAVDSGSPVAGAAPQKGFGVPWVVPPASSHVARMRFLDERRFRQDEALSAAENAARFGRVLGLLDVYGGMSNLPKPPGAMMPSVLEVVFKDKGKGEWQYGYAFGDPEAGLRVFREMAANPSPWTVGKRLLVDAKVPYMKVAVAAAG